MTVATRALAGMTIGLGVGGAAVLWALSQSEVRAPECPGGWHPATVARPSGTRIIAACRREAPDATLALVRTTDPAERVAASLLNRALRAAGAPSDPADTPDRHATADHAASVLGNSSDGPALPLRADVFFLAAGHRFGLLNVVHTPNAPFADRNALARWIDTIGGTAPWGAPNPGPMTAQCPEGFVSRPNPHPHGIVMCAFAPGTARFTMIVLDWDEGGFDTDQDRSLIASAIATRVATTQGSRARIVVPPEPFTLAAHVDAFHTEIDTGETTGTALDGLAMLPSEGLRDVMVVGAGEPGAALERASGQMLATSGALHNARRKLLTIAVALGAVVAAFGAFAGVRSGRSPRA